MQIKLIAIGKTDNNELQTLIEAYQKRLWHYIRFDFEIIPDIKNTKHLSEAQQKEKEGELILSKLQNSDVLVLLDENGKQIVHRIIEEQKRDKILIIATNEAEEIALAAQSVEVG